jgi:titin
MNATGIDIERSADGITFVQIATVGPTVVSYTDTSVQPNTNYWYRVRAFTAGGTSPYSNTAMVRTPSI